MTNIFTFEVLQLTLLLLWFLMPAMLANMAASLSGLILLRWRGWTWPLDCRLTWRGERLLGANKTWRGLLVGVLFGSIGGFIQWWLADVSALSWVTLPHYQVFPLALFVGALAGLGALLGDAVKSFFKRRLGFRPGQQWVVIDQIDFPLGALALTGWTLSWAGQLREIAMALGVLLVLMVFVTLLVNWVAVKLKLKEAM